MSKREVKSMLGSILSTPGPAFTPAPTTETKGGTVTVRKMGRPKVKPEPASPAEAGCKIGETRITTIMDKGLIETVRRIAYWDRRSVKTIMSMAVEQFVERYEKEHGRPEPIPANDKLNTTP